MVTLANAREAAENRNAVRAWAWCAPNLLLDLVLAAEHVVNVGEVVSAGEEAIGLAGGGIALLEVGLLTEVAHLEGISRVLTIMLT